MRTEALLGAQEESKVFGDFEVECTVFNHEPVDVYGIYMDEAPEQIEIGVTFGFAISIRNALASHVKGHRYERTFAVKVCFHLCNDQEKVVAEFDGEYINCFEDEDHNTIDPSFLCNDVWEKLLWRLVARLKPYAKEVLLDLMEERRQEIKEYGR